MNSHEITMFLSGADTIEHLASAIRKSLLSFGVQVNPANVGFVEKPHDPTGFIAQVLNLKVAARFEYAKFTGTSPAIISGQYAFYLKTGETEKKLSTVLRIFSTNDIALPSGENIRSSAGELPQFARKIQTAVSYSLLKEVIEQLESWDYSR